MNLVENKWTIRLSNDLIRAEKTISRGFHPQGRWGTSWKYKDQSLPDSNWPLSSRLCTLISLAKDRAHLIRPQNVSDSGFEDRKFRVLDLAQ